MSDSKPSSPESQPPRSRRKRKDTRTDVLDERTGERGKEWLKDIDLTRAAENTLVGLVLFFGRYPVTFFHVLFRPHPLYESLIFDARYKSDAQVRFTRPVTFLVVSGFIYLSFALTTLGTFLPAQVVIEPLQILIDRMPKEIGDLNLETITAFMLPFVLAVALYAYIATLVFRMVRAPAPFKIHLNISCYIVGAVSVVLNLATVASVRAWDLALADGDSLIRSVPLLILVVALWALMAFSLFRYLDLVRRAGRAGWVKALAGSAVSVAAFYGVAQGVLFALLPLIEKLE